MKKALATALMVMILASISLFSQGKKKDKGEFINYVNETWENIKRSVEDYNTKPEKINKKFILDFSNYNIPKSLDKFKTVWYNKPIMQGSTGTCWSFASTSFMESEVHKLQGIDVQLSPMFTVYWEYVARAERFVDEHGDCYISEGSQNNAILRVLRDYGAVPAEFYTALLEGQTYYSHDNLVKEVRNYLNYCKKNSIWNKEEVVKNVKSILNYYMTEPPTEFTYNGVKYTPKSFANDYLKLNPDDYVQVMSLLEGGFWTKTIYDVPDNWWKSYEYYNVPMEDFIGSLDNALANGYSVALGGDVSEAGMYSYKDASVIPSFDIPSEYIDDQAKQFRFSNKTTDDDHAIHLVGKATNSSGDWYLIKDSGSGARNGLHKGYYFFHRDYVKLKMLTFLVNKNAVKDLLSKFE